MANNLKKLNRSGLLQLLLEVEEENEDLRRQIGELKAQIEDRNIRIEKSGDIAAAALELNGVFSSAQAACQQYVDNIKARHDELDETCHRIEQETREKCRMLERETEAKCREKEEQTAAECEKMLAEAKEKCGGDESDVTEEADSANEDGEASPEEDK